MSSTIDNKVMALFNALQAKKKEVDAASEKPRWKTSCVLGYQPDNISSHTNIATITDLAKLVDYASFLLAKADYWTEANAALNVEVDFKWMGYSLEQWISDLTARAAQINVNAKRKELAALEARVNSIISVEQRRELELAELTKLIT